MNKAELQERLRKENVPSHYYSLEGGMPDEKLCLERTGMGWDVYYSERGLKTSLKSFTSEEKASSYFFQRIRETREFWRR